jgi:ketopantoate hydroxymethyltransferase
MKICALLVLRELEVQHSGGVKAMTDEQIERGIELIKAMLAEREAGANAKVIEGVTEPVPALPPPCRERKKTAPSSAGKTS